MAMRRLALLPRGAFRSAREIAEEHRIPPALMAKLMQRLARKGLVAAHHGTKGGYRIARPASKISVRDVIEAIEGPVVMLECCDPCKDGCLQETGCTVRAPLYRVQQRIVAELSRTTVGDLR